MERAIALADEGMEPWQIAAALGIQERAVLVALGDPAPAGGAVRAVEQAASLVPAGWPGREGADASAEVEIHKPESTAPASPQVSASEPVENPAAPGPTYGTPASAAAGSNAVQTLNGRIAALGTTVSQIRDWARRTSRPVPDRGMIPARLVDEWAVEHATPLADLDQPTDDDAPGHLVPAFLDTAAIAEPIGVTVQDLTALYEPEALPCGCDPSWGYHGAPCTAVTPPGEQHVHDPFTAWREDGIPYATCECGQTWERTTCTYCPAIVSALHVATHGPAHKHCAAKHTERTNP